MFWKWHTLLGYWVARRLFNQRWAVETDWIWEWMQTQFSRMATYDDVAARAFYGHLLLHKGQGMGARNEGVRLLRLAAQAGDAKSAYQLGVYSLQDNIHQAGDPQQAADWFELALQHGHPAAGIKLLELYAEDGPAQTSDEKKAERIRQQLGDHPLI